MIISICGDICSECPRYKATVSNNTEELKTLAELWYRLGFRDHIAEPDEMRCAGCQKEKFCSYGLTGCDHLSGLSTCGECSLFPCEKNNAVFTRSKRNEEICRNKCEAHVFQQYKKAFFTKEKTLSAIFEVKFHRKPNL